MLTRASNEDNNYLEQLHYYGLGIRFSRNLMKTQQAPKAIQLASGYLDSLGLSGYIRFLEGDTRSAVRFGQSPKSLKRQYAAIKTSAYCSDKICVERNFIIAKSSLSFILIDRHNIDDQRAANLQDILAVFIDSVDAWLESYLIRSDLSQVLQKSLVELIESSRDLIKCHTQASGELLSSMVAKFPVLGLEADQEDMILDIIKIALDKHINLIENQISNNNVLGDTLMESVDALNNSDQYKNDEPPDDASTCVELF